LGSYGLDQDPSIVKDFTNPELVPRLNGEFVEAGADEYPAHDFNFMKVAVDGGDCAVAEGVCGMCGRGVEFVVIVAVVVVVV